MLVRNRSEAVYSCREAGKHGSIEKGEPMRTEPFTMERDVLNIGDVVEITEGKLPRSYYYTAEPAAAMSKNFEFSRRIVSTHGTVTGKVLNGSTYTVDITFDED